MKKVTFLALLALVFSLGAGFLQAAEAASDDEFNNLPGVMNDLERSEADAQAFGVPEAPAASAAVNDSARTDDSMYTGCAICCSGFRNEPTLSCANGGVAHTFHKACIAQAYTSRPGCPMCTFPVLGVPVSRLDQMYLFNAVDRFCRGEAAQQALFADFAYAASAQNALNLFARNRTVSVRVRGGRAAHVFTDGMTAVHYAFYCLPAEVLAVLLGQPWATAPLFQEAVNKEMTRTRKTVLDVYYERPQLADPFLLHKLIRLGARACLHKLDVLEDVLPLNDLNLVQRALAAFLRGEPLPIPSHGYTMIHRAVRNGCSVEIITELLNAGFQGDVPAYGDYCSQTPLHLAAQQGNARLPVMQLLVGRGYKIHARDRNGLTPLAVARNLAADQTSWVACDRMVAYLEMLESHDQEIRDEAAWFCTIQ